MGYDALLRFDRSRHIPLWETPSSLLINSVNYLASTPSRSAVIKFGIATALFLSHAVDYCVYFRRQSVHIFLFDIALDCSIVAIAT
jgi:hypothetical protein